MSPKRSAVGLLLSLSMVLMAALAAPPAHAQTGTLTGIYSFTDGADGANPVGGVVADANGTLYGETSIGSAVRCTSKAQPSLGCGTVYSFNPTAGLKVLASFSGPNGAHGNNTLTLVGTTDAEAIDSHSSQHGNPRPSQNFGPLVLVCNRDRS